MPNNITFVISFMSCCFKGEKKICTKLPVTLSSALAAYCAQGIPSASERMMKKLINEVTMVYVLKSFTVMKIFLRRVPDAVLFVDKKAVTLNPSPHHSRK